MTAELSRYRTGLLFIRRTRKRGRYYQWPSDVFGIGTSYRGRWHSIGRATLAISLVQVNK